MSNTVYNLRHLEELAGGSDDFVQSMVETFLEHTPGQLQEMREAYKAHNLDTLGQVAHKIKPNIDLFGIADIMKDIRVVEEKAKHGEDDEQLKSSLSRVEHYLELTFSQLKQR